MKTRWTFSILGILVLISLIGCTTATPEPVDGYVAVAPPVLRAGQTEGVAISLFSGQQPAKGKVHLALVKDGRSVARASGRIDGSGVVLLRVPQLPEGGYQLQVKGPGFQDQAPLRVEEGTLLFVETDKPIYKPGQSLLIRTLTLDPELMPLPAEVTIEVQDAKGIKVFKKVMQTDEFGMATVEMPLSTEPNRGVWKVTARSGKRDAQVDVRVEEYVLPKYEVTIDLPKDWILAREPITGAVEAEYSFGKPVRGEVEIVAFRYVGTWEEFATFTQELDGRSSFELQPVGFVAGVPSARGMGNVRLDVTVREKATGYEEKSTRLLTVAPTPVSLQVIPESAVFKPSLPLTFLIIAETPDNRPLDRDVTVNLTYMSADFDQIEQRSYNVRTEGGKGLLKVVPPASSVALTVEATAEQAHVSLTLEASYSPSGNFIHVEQVSQGPLKVGDRAQFHVHATREAPNLYYEIISRGRVILSQVSRSSDIVFPLTLLMAPSSRLLVYQVLPNGEVAADYVPFEVEGNYPNHVEVGFSAEEVSPGDGVSINIRSQGLSRVGLVAVDRSVLILAENRLNLQQVFDELERLYMQPQVELHEARSLTRITARGAKETFHNAGVVVMSNKRVPEGEEYRSPFQRGIFREAVVAMAAIDRVAAMAAPTPVPALRVRKAEAPSGLAEVQRVRQFFPETWLWTDVTTDGRGRASVPVVAPDSITTWALRAIAISKKHGLGVAESELRVFQPFFLQVDLPYSAIRGEELPLKVALYNYLDSPQEIYVELEPAEGLDLLDDAAKIVMLGPNDIGSVEFRIRPTGLGSLPLKVSARSREAADAVIKDLLVEPEGVSRENVENLVLSAGDRRTLDIRVPPDAIRGSARAHVSLSGSYLTQTIEGLEGLLRMPFGCGEQNMVLFAPNVFVANYLRESGQLKPEVMARAEHLMTTGYQRELTYRRRDGSFSAFGDRDQEGSLWLTAFVLKTFAQARGLLYIDQSVLDEAAAWTLGHQRADGSFEPVGFLHHQELLGGLQGNTALTAYVAIALQEAGEATASARAVGYLEKGLDSIEDPYTMAIVSYALELGGSNRAGEAYDGLMSMAIEDKQGLHWGTVVMIAEPRRKDHVDSREPRHGDRSAAIETTGYAILAILEHGDRLNASRAARWLVSQRNAYGGFGSTQDTVVGLQALTEFATDARSDVEMTVTLTSGDWEKRVKITPDSADVLHTLEVPIGGKIEITTEGRGQVVAQVIRRFNMPEVERPEAQVFQIDVDYGTEPRGGRRTDHRVGQGAVHSTRDYRVGHGCPGHIGAHGFRPGN